MNVECKTKRKIESEIRDLLIQKNAEGIEQLDLLYGTSAMAFLVSNFRHSLNQIDLDSAYNNGLFNAWLYGHAIDENKNFGYIPVNDFS